MADISITAASVLASAAATIDRTHNAGATITAGQSVYLDTGTSPAKWKLADANNAGMTVVGIALDGASDGQPIRVCTKDSSFTPGGTLSLAASDGKNVLVVSATAGAVAPVGDLAATMYPIVLGVALTTTTMNLNPTVGTAVLT